MTVSTTLVSHSYQPGAAMAAESIPFQFLDLGDIAVVHIAAATGARTPLAIDTDYSITGDFVAGTASITAKAAWPGGDVFEVSRNTEALQKLSIPAHEPLPSASLEHEMDRLVLRQQEVGALAQNIGQRALMVPVGEIAPEADSLAGANGKILGIVGGRVVPVVNVAGQPGGNTMAIGAFTTAPSLSVPAGTDLVQTSGFMTKAGPGKARYAYDPLVDAAYVAANPLSSFLAANGRGFRLSEAVIDPRMLGAVVDGLSDDSAALTATFAVAAALKAEVELPEGVMRCRDVVVPSGAIIRGQGRDRTTLRRSGALSGGILTCAEGAGDMLLLDFAIDGASAADARSLALFDKHGSNIVWKSVAFRNGCDRWALRFNPATAFKHIHLLDCVFENCPAGGHIVLPYGPEVRGSSDFRVIGCTFDRCGGNISSLRDYETGLAGWERFDFYFNCKFNFNTVTNCLFAGADGPIPNEWWGVTGFQQIGNYLDSGTRGLSAASGNRDVLIIDNIIKNQTIYAMEAGHSRNVTVARNIIVNCATFYKDTSSAGSDTRIDNLTIVDNTIIGTGRSFYDGGNSPEFIRVGNSGASVPTAIRIERNRFYDGEYMRTVMTCAGHDALPTITFAGGGTGANATFTFKGVTARIRARGFGYTSAPALTVVANDGTGAGATATCTIDAAGRIATVTLTDAGSGYTLPPKVVFSGGGGTGGEVEILLGIDTVTPVGGTGYSDSTFTVSGNGAYASASGSFTQTGGVPGSCTVTTPGAGFGRGSDYHIESNVYEGRTYASTTGFISMGGGRLRSLNNLYRRTTHYDSAHHNDSGGSVGYSYSGKTNPLTHGDTIVSDGDRAEMRGAILSGGMTAFGTTSAGAPRYGMRFARPQIAGNFTYSILVNDTGGSTVVEDVDIREWSGTVASLRSNVNASVLVGLGTGEFLIAAGSYVNLGTARKKGGRVRLRYVGSDGTRTIKLRYDGTASAQSRILAKVNFVCAQNNGAPQANEVVVAWGNGSAASNAPFSYQGGGTTATIASALDGGTPSRMETTITLPASNNAWMATLDIEAGLNAATSFADLAVRIA